MALMILTSQFLGIAPFDNPSEFSGSFFSSVWQSIFVQNHAARAHATYLLPQCVIIRIKNNLSKIFLTNCSSYISVSLMMPVHLEAVLGAVTVSG